MMLCPAPARQCRGEPRAVGLAAWVAVVLLAGACAPGAGAPAESAPPVPGAATDGDGSATTVTPNEVPEPACPDPADLPLGGRLLDAARPDGADGTPPPVPVVHLEAPDLLRLTSSDELAPDGTPCHDDDVVIVGGADGIDPLSEGAAALLRERTPVLVLEADAEALVDVAAQAGDGIIPVVVAPERAPESASETESDSEPEPEPETAPEPDSDGPVETLELLRAAGDDRPLRWAASTSAHARTLEDTLAGLTDAGFTATRWTPSDGGGAAGAGGSIDELWLGDVRTVETALMAAVAAVRRGAAFVAVDGGDLRAGVERTGRIREAVERLRPDGRIVLVGDVGEATAWQIDTVSTGTSLPGGGFLPLEERRIVALYGTPGTSALGMLGEQDVEETVVRAREIAERYADASDGRVVVPGLDVITTIASSAAEPTGDYSRRVPIERIRPLVDRARDEGMAVLLDLQPGRTSFLDQAQEYEELLREPHVHLALDPEWRLGPRDRHLIRIGSVEADEVQAVADWLADLVRRERLPQKVLMLHQFTTAMLPDRDTIVVPPELIGVVHVDGQGPLATKNSTYAALTAGAEERWLWGWKNFTRIDTPVATPEQALDRVPVPTIVTYQ